MPVMFLKATSIENIKWHWWWWTHKRRILFRVFDNIDMGKKSMSNVDISTVMRCTKEKWESCSPSVIKNCSLYRLKQAENHTAEEWGDLHLETVDNMMRGASEHGVSFRRIG